MYLSRVRADTEAWQPSGWRKNNVGFSRLLRVKIDDFVWFTDGVGGTHSELATTKPRRLKTRLLSVLQLYSFWARLLAALRTVNELRLSSKVPVLWARGLLPYVRIAGEDCNWCR